MSNDFESESEAIAQHQGGEIVMRRLREELAKVATFLATDDGSEIMKPKQKRAARHGKKSSKK